MLLTVSDISNTSWGKEEIEVEEEDWFDREFKKDQLARDNVSSSSSAAPFGSPPSGAEEAVFLEDSVNLSADAVAGVTGPPVPPSVPEPRYWVMKEQPFPAKLTADKEWVDCEICRRWIHAAGSYLPDVNIGPGNIDFALQAACKDTWIIHFVDMVRVPVNFPLEKTEKTPVFSDPSGFNLDQSARCKEIYEEDVDRRAMTSMFDYFKSHYGFGMLPDLVCTRMGKCKQFPFEKKNRDNNNKWYGEHAWPYATCFRPDFLPIPPPIPPIPPQLQMYLGMEMLKPIAASFVKPIAKEWELKPEERPQGEWTPADF